MSKIALIILSVNFLFFSYSQEKIEPHLSPNLQPKNGKSEQIVKRTAYVTSFNTEFNVPNWVFEHITKEMLAGHKKPTQSTKGYPNFKENKVEIGNSYYKTGYDHGHMCPKANFYWSQKAYDESFEMCNMAPQNGALNRGIWCRLESLVRTWVETDKKNSDYYVVTGCMLDEISDTLCLDNGVQIMVPRYFYKVIVKKTKGKYKEGIAFVMENTYLRCEVPFEDFTLSIDAVEEITGLNFFPNLSKSTEKKIEGKKGKFDLSIELKNCFCGTKDTEPLKRKVKKCSRL